MDAALRHVNGEQSLAQHWRNDRSEGACKRSAVSDEHCDTSVA
jgi:hypothetical protein